MRYELFIGLRYLRAKRKEAFISLITLMATAGVAIGVMTLDIALSVMTGLEEDLRARILGFNPHVLVLSHTGSIAGYSDLVTRVDAMPGVSRAAPFVYGQVMLASAESMSGVLLRGIDAGQPDISDLARHLTAGHLEQLAKRHVVPLSEGRGATVELAGIILGGELALQLGVSVGDAVSVISPIGTPSAVGMVPRVRRFAVVGLFNSGMSEYDSALAYIALNDAQRFFGLDGAVTGLEVRLTDLYQARAVGSRIAQNLGFPYRVRDWMEINHNLFAALKLEKTVYFIVLLLIILVAAFNIVATLIMVVMEKRKDIAILKSMGATNRGIANIFVLKGIVIGVIGTLFGNLLGYAGCWALRRYEFIELPKDVFYVSTVPVKMLPEYFLAVTLASVIICLLATIYPARQAARLVPVDIIRYE
jgi:lipoprotein-releasing system permease protein